MADPTPKDLIKRYEAAEKVRQLWESTWRDAYRLTMPNRNVLENSTPGQWRGDFIFDSTGVNSTHKLANRLVDLIFPIGKDFVELVPGTSFEGSKEAVRGQLQHITEQFHAAVWRSNFSTAIHEDILELLIGTGIMQFLEGPLENPFHFVPIPTPTCAIEEGPLGTVGSVYRCRKIKVNLIELTWPDATISDTDRHAAANDPEKTKEIIECTYPVDETRQAFAPARPLEWRYTVIDREQEKFLLEKPRVFKAASPWLVTRYAKAPDEDFGRGPILFALGDIRTANKVVELILKNASLSVTGVYTGVNDGVLNPNTARIAPGVVIPVAYNPGHPRGASLAALERAGDFDVGQLVLEDLRFAIKQALFDNNLPPESGPVRSATEFVERLRELMVDIGPAAGRIASELVEPMVHRGLHILANKNLIDIPEDLIVASDQIEVRIVSPIAQRQNMEVVERVARWLELTGFLGEQMLALGAKIEDLPQFFAEQLQVPQELVRNEQERRQMTDNIARMVAQMQVEAQQQQQAQQEAA